MNNLQKELKNLKFKPSENWCKQTLEILEDISNEDLHPNTLTVKENIVMKLKLNYRKVEIIFALALLFLAIPLFYAFYSNKIESMDKDREDIISQILENNLLFALTNNKVSASENELENLAKTLKGEAFNFDVNAKYYYVKNKVLTGKRVNECNTTLPFGLLDSSAGEYIEEYKNYFEDGNTFKTLKINTDLNGKVLTAYKTEKITVNNQATETSEEYNGGAYIEKESSVYDIPKMSGSIVVENSSIPEPKTADDFMKLYFGENYSIDWNYTYKNTEYIAVKSIGENGCMSYTTPAQFFNRISIYLIEKRTLKVSKYITYIESADEGNLVSEIESVEMYNQDPNQVNFDAEFKINVNKPVKEIVRENVEFPKINGTDESNRVFDNMKSNNVELFYPAQWSEVSLDTAGYYDPRYTVLQDSTSARLDRNFYAEGILGDAIYKQANPENNSPLLLSTLANYSLKERSNGIMFTVEVFNTLDYDKVLETVKYSYHKILEESLTDVMINLNESNYPAKLLHLKGYTSTYQIKDKQVDASCGMNSGCWDYYDHLLLQKDNKTYVVNIGDFMIGLEPFDNYMSLKIYDLNLEQNINFMKNSLKERIDNFSSVTIGAN